MTLHSPAQRPAPAPLATTEQVAAYLQMGVDKLADMRSAGRGPRFIKIGRNVRYSWHDVNAFVASCAIAGAAA